MRAEALDIDDFFEWAKQSQHSAALMDKFNRVAAELKQEDEARQAAGKISWAIKPVKHSRAWGAKLPDKVIPSCFPQLSNCLLHCSHDVVLFSHIILSRLSRLTMQSCYDFDEEGPLGSPFKQVGEQLKRVAECIETAIITQQTPAHELAKTLPQGYVEMLHVAVVAAAAAAVEIILCVCVNRSYVIFGCSGPVVNFAGLVSSLTAVKTTAAYLAEARERLIQQRQQSQYSPDHTVSNTPQHCVGTGIPPVDSIQQMADSMQVMPSTGDCDTGNGVFMTGVTFPLSPQASQSLESVYSMTNSGASPTATTMRRTRTENGLLSPSQQKKAIEKTAEALGISIVPFSPIQRPSTAQRLLNERREADGLGTLLQSPSPSRTLPRAASSGVLLSPTGKHQLAKLNLSATCRDDKGNIVATCTGKPLTPTSRNDTHDESVLMCDMPPVRLGPSKRLLPPVNTSFTATATTMLSPTSAIGDDHDMIELMAMPSFNSGCTPSPTRCKTASFNSRHISGLLLSPVSPQSYQRYYGQSSDSVAPTTITAQPHERRRLAQLTRSSYNPSLSSTSTAIRTSPKSKQFTFPTSPGPHHQRQRSNSPPSQLRGIGSGYGGRTRIDLQEFHKRLQQL